MVVNGRASPLPRTQSASPVRLGRPEEHRILRLQVAMHHALASFGGDDNSPKGPKYPKMRYTDIMVSILGIVIMVLAIYSVFGYLDPWGSDLDTKSRE